MWISPLPPNWLREEDLVPSVGVGFHVAFGYLRHCLTVRYNRVKGTSSFRLMTISRWVMLSKGHALNVYMPGSFPAIGVGNVEPLVAETSRWRDCNSGLRSAMLHQTTVKALMRTQCRQI